MSTLVIPFTDILNKSIKHSNIKIYMLKKILYKILKGKRNFNIELSLKGVRFQNTF